jgi:hypothetical protein
MHRYLTELRRRALFVRAARDLLAAGAAAAAATAVVSWLLGPTPPTAAVVLAWCCIGVAGAAPVFLRRRRDPSVEGGAAAGLLAARAPDLVSSARTARELEAGLAPTSSQSLAAAHRAYVLAELAAHPPSRVVPLSALAARTNLLALVIALVSVALLAGSASVRAGAYALTHPGARSRDGHRVASIVRIDRVRIVPPEYAGQPPQDLAPASRIGAMRGTVIELAVSPLSRALTALELRFDDGRRLPVRLDGDSPGLVRFLASASATARFVASSAEGPIEDPATLAVDLFEDRAPTVHLSEPAGDLEVDFGDMVVLVADAEDDVRLERLEIVLTGVDGRETRHPFTPSAELPRAASGLVPVLIEELHAEPGDVITVHAEARDTDDVSGPHVSRSATRSLRLRSQADAAEEALSTIEAMRDAALELLADRIEVAVPEDAAEGDARLEALGGKTESLLDALTSAGNGALGEAVRATDRGVYLAIARRLATALERERRAYRGREPERRRDENDEAIRELEGDVLTLSALLLRARADDAAAIARELESLRRRMASLLAELRRARTPEAMRELMATIARAQRRVEELRARMARMGEGSPREFENLSEEEVEQTEQALSRMEEALEGDDLDAAARALTGLEQQIDMLARALGQSQEAVAEERFGERERALADVIDRLMSLEAEQRELAARTSSARTSAAERAVAAEAERARAAAANLQDDARSAARALDEVEGRGLASSEREALEAARQRLRDVEAALGTGDLGEARRMAAEASGTLSDLWRGLDLDAMMFPGHDGRLGESARAARDAERRASALERAIEGAIPDLGRHLDEAERAQLRADASRQASAREATSQLEARLERLPMGPTGAEIAAGLHEAASQMETAEEGLRGEDAPGAARAQDDAARRLTEVRRRIEMEQQSQSGGGGDGSESTVSREAVVIPGAGAFETPMEQRRRVLDAMGDPAPGGYEEAIRRYYEGLLR